MNSESIPFVDEDGELRCAKCAQGQVVPGTLLCAGCGPAAAPARAPVCSICHVARVWKGDTCELCRSLCVPRPSTCRGNCRACTEVLFCDEEIGHAA